MGVFLGNHSVTFTSYRKTDSPITVEIIQRTISGNYENSRVSYIGSNVFRTCSMLIAVNFPNCTTIGSYAFDECSMLTTASFPNCTTIGNYAFQECSQLATVNFLNCTTIDMGAFTSCSALTTVNFPNCTTIDSYTFYRCYQLTDISLPNCTIIGNYAFGYCYRLLSLYLISVSQVPILGNSVFHSTPIGGRTTSTNGVYGSVFVPASLYNSFLTATNWSSISSRIVRI